MERRLMRTMPVAFNIKGYRDGQFQPVHYASHAWCAEMFSRRRKEYRQLGSAAVIKDGDDYLLGYGRPGSTFWRVVARVAPDDVMTLSNVFSSPGAQLLTQEITGMNTLAKRDPRSSVGGWLVPRLPHDDRYYNKDVFAARRVAYTDGLQVRAGVILNPTLCVPQVRTINTEKAKVVRKRIAEWKKLMHTLHAVVQTPKTPRWAAPALPALPKFSDAIDGSVAISLLQNARSRTYDTTYDFTLHKQIVPPTYMKNLIRNATAPLREKWYEEEGVYEWSPA